MAVAAPPSGPRCYVAVVGAGDAPGDGATAGQAEAVGRGLAERGAVVVCGGLGGVMAAVCRGVAAGGGVSVGLLPGTDRAAANPWVTLALPTGLGEARNACVARSADAVVAIGGGYGTLSEIAFALRAGTPVVGLGTWVLALEGSGDDGIHRATSPSHAVTLAMSLAEPR
ncbi:MAG: LOG family protein [Actinobacteria bacterium]|nr:LOG family protein [Actinomycetota bacterium]